MERTPGARGERQRLIAHSKKRIIEGRGRGQKKRHPEDVGRVKGL
jgi:hypothetical protein